MTYDEVVGQWKVLAERKSVAVMKDEIAMFVGDAKKAGATLKQLLASQNRILLMWYPESWAAAQLEHTHWHQKPLFEAGKKSIAAAFATALKEAYANEVAQNKVVKTEPVAKPKAAAPAVDPGHPVFDNLEDFTAWKNKRAAQ